MILGLKVPLKKSSQEAQFEPCILLWDRLLYHVMIYAWPYTFGKNQRIDFRSSKWFEWKKNEADEIRSGRPLLMIDSRNST